MNIPFTKMHGLGNDFVVFDGFTHPVEFHAADIVDICDRHTGIGADGVIVVRPGRAGTRADGFMDYFNADGTSAEMCGNGVRVTAKFLIDNAYAHPDQSLRIDTRAGIKELSVTTSRGLLQTARVNMGAPTLADTGIPVRDSAEVTDTVAIDTDWGEISFTTVSMGNPHAIAFLDEADLEDTIFNGARMLQNLEVDRIGAVIESHPAFPGKTNVEFASVGDDGQVISMRVFERGVGQTLACGTGACATLVAAVLTGRTGRSATLRLAGGDLFIEWSESGNIYLTGPASTSYAGTWLASGLATTV